jgi:hypothetical protein
MIRLLIFFLLVNILFGFYITSDDNGRLNQLLKQRSLENDNEYVWFTRNIPDETKQDQSRQQEDFFHSKMFHRKYPFVKNVMHETK